MVVAVLFIVRESLIWPRRLWAMDLLSDIVLEEIDYGNWVGQESDKV